MTYERLLSFGNVFQLSISCDPDVLIREISQFPFAQYNTKKPENNRRGLSITSLDGMINGVDLESLPEIGLNYGEMDFNKFTPVYHSSPETQKIVSPFIGHVGRSHFLSLKKGGYFPPHRDDRGYDDEQKTFRIIVPLRQCTPPKFHFIYNGADIHFNIGYAYFVNTNIEHSVFSFTDDNLFAVLNIASNPVSHRIVLANMYSR